MSIAERYPIGRKLSAVAAASAMAAGACSPEVSHPVDPLEIDSVALVYAHGIPGSVPVGEHVREDVPQTFQNAWDILHDVTGTVPEGVEIRVVGGLVLGEDMGKMNDTCSEDPRSDLFNNVTDAAREEYDEQLGDQDLLAVVMQRADGFACSKNSETEHGPNASASMYGRNVVFYNGEWAAKPAGARTVAHEFGHALLDFSHNGLVDCGESDVVEVNSACEIDENGDRYTVMGTGGVLMEDRIFNGFEERRLGNISDSQITSLEDTGVHNLRLSSLDVPREDARKIIRVPLSPQELGEIHEQTGATAIYIELSPADASWLGVKTHLVDERVFEGADASQSYLLSPGMPAARLCVREGEAANFVFQGKELRIEVEELQHVTDVKAGWADLEVTLQ